MLVLSDYSHRDNICMILDTDDMKVEHIPLPDVYKSGVDVWGIDSKRKKVVSLYYKGEEQIFNIRNLDFYLNKNVIGIGARNGHVIRTIKFAWDFVLNFIWYDSGEIIFFMDNTATTIRIRRDGTPTILSRKVGGFHKILESDSIVKGYDNNSFKAMVLKSLLVGETYKVG